MKKADVKISGVYRAKVSGHVTRVRIEETHPNGGWWGVNLSSDREVRIRTAARLREIPQGLSAPQETAKIIESGLFNIKKGDPQ